MSHTSKGKKAEPLGPTESLRAPRLPVGKRHCLVVWSEGRPRTHTLPSSGSAVIGRGEEADVRIESTTVSRRHALLSLGSGQARLADAGSRNGVRVNGERLAGERLLGYGDILTFGDVTAVFEEDRRATIDIAVAGGAALAESAGRRIDLGGEVVLLAAPAMLHVYAQLERLGRTDLTVLVLGETGTGKELAARALRFWSARRERPFVAINCAALPDSLAESELFGYERGAFSGAAGAKPGLLESAPGGTIFLDEIGDLSAAVQAKLLRALETRRLTRLGAVEERPFDVRVVAATHRDLEADVRAGRFREDLYYRISVGVVRLPPLRERQEELPLLARGFLEAAGARLGRPAAALTPAALARLAAHSWPGNLRELRNLMEYLAALATDAQIGPEAIGQRLGPGVAASAGAEASAGAVPAGGESGRRAARAHDVVPDDTGPASVEPLSAATRDFERRSIVAALETTTGNKTRAAKLLGIPLRTFMTKVKRHGL